MTGVRNRSRPYFYMVVVGLFLGLGVVGYVCRYDYQMATPEIQVRINRFTGEIYSRARPRRGGQFYPWIKGYYTDAGNLDADTYRKHGNAMWEK
jgi:hypothetical protein